jgi:hypothetical protein
MLPGGNGFGSTMLTSRGQRTKTMASSHWILALLPKGLQVKAPLTDELGRESTSLPFCTSSIWVCGTMQYGPITAVRCR